VRETLEAIGRRNIRDHMPEQHRLFFSQLPLLIAGSVDAGGQRWASALAGPPGFLSSPDPRHLDVRARPLAADPLSRSLTGGSMIGLLGIEPHTRRRNRMNGVVEAVRPDGFSVRVVRSFGNCPKYIQARAPRWVPAAAGETAVQRSAALDAGMRRLVAGADTFFIATAYRGAESGAGERPHGADVSHRGGKPGFVRVDDAHTLTIPDFVGNSYFNTIGNLLLEPRGGLLFIDFESGDLLHLAGEVQVIFESEEAGAFKGAERLLRFHVHEALCIEQALPLRWGEAELSPFATATGSWS